MHSLEIIHRNNRLAEAKARARSLCSTLPLGKAAIEAYNKGFQAGLESSLLSERESIWEEVKA